MAKTTARDRNQQKPHTEVPQQQQQSRPSGKAVYRLERQLLSDERFGAKDRGIRQMYLLQPFFMSIPEQIGQLGASYWVVWELRDWAVNEGLFEIKREGNKKVFVPILDGWTTKTQRFLAIKEVDLKYRCAVRIANDALESKLPGGWVWPQFAPWGDEMSARSTAVKQALRQVRLQLVNRFATRLIDQHYEYRPLIIGASEVQTSTVETKQAPKSPAKQTPEEILRGYGCVDPESFIKDVVKPARNLNVRVKDDSELVHMIGTLYKRIGDESKRNNERRHGIGWFGGIGVVIERYIDWLAEKGWSYVAKELLVYDYQMFQHSTVKRKEPDL
jgi:hypothetical protein